MSTDHLGRTDEQFAIEFGRYLVGAAREMMKVLNDEALDELQDREFDSERRGEAWRGLEEAIYEFEKRADRAYPKPSI
jgi:hypothetical protein